MKGSRKLMAKLTGRYIKILQLQYFPCHSICCLCVDIVVLNCYDNVSITRQFDTIIVAYYFYMAH